MSLVLYFDAVGLEVGAGYVGDVLEEDEGDGLVGGFVLVEGERLFAEGEPALGPDPGADAVFLDADPALADEGGAGGGGAWTGLLPACVGAEMGGGAASA